jgi:glycosyltransferase involved in cell wall biosynthesis
MKVAIVHDYLNQYGGAERVLDEIKLLFPAAPVLVSIYDPARMPPAYRDWDVRPSWLNRVPFANRKHQALLPLYPQVFENFDLSDYDLVVSSSSGFAHGVLTGPQTTHVCYCHSPPRFLWDYHKYVERERLGRVARTLVSHSLAQLRQWDRTSADRADAWISTSRVVRERILKYYGKDSVIIPPPVNTGRFEVGEGPGQYYLMLMRLVGWKRPDIVVEACSRLGEALVVAGDGRDLAHLRSIAGSSVRFVGRVNDAQMRGLYRDCRALILPSEEDFGITPLEAMSAGRPVIAFGRGGALDTVIPGVTGLLFAEQTADSVAGALAKFVQIRFSPATIRAHAAQYDSALFRDRLARFIDAQLAARTAGTGPARPAPAQVIAA